MDFKKIIIKLKMINFIKLISKTFLHELEFYKYGLIRDERSIPFLEPRGQVDLNGWPLESWLASHWVWIICVDQIVGKVHNDDL